MSAKVWTVEEIRDLVQNNDEVCCRALVNLYRKQTEDEKEVKSTRESNGVGFNSYDAEFLTNVAEFYLKYGFLSSKQLEYVRKKLKKYTKQLTKIANKEI